MESMSLLQDRETAARLLALRLASLRGTRPLILAIPRGAAPMGLILAEELHGDLDVVLVHKLGAPGQPELAIGAVDEEGEVVLHPATAWMAEEDYVVEESKRQRQVLRERRARYTPGRGPLEVRGRKVVIVDDGVATGATIESAIRAVRKREPEELIVAVGVISSVALARLQRLADRVVCLMSPEDFFSVGEFFVDFQQVTDEEVVAALRSAERREAAPSNASGR